MATKRKFFRRTKPAVGDKAEKPREKQTKKKVQRIVVQDTPKQSSSFLKSLKMPQFPNIYRSIAEQIKFHSQKLPLTKKNFDQIRNNWSWKKTGIGFVAVMITVGILLHGLLMLRAGKNLMGVLSDRGKLQDQMHIWEDIAKKYPRYRDADFQVALFAYQLGDRATAETYLGKTLTADPNYAPALKLQKMLEN